VYWYLTILLDEVKIIHQDFKQLLVIKLNYRKQKTERHKF